MTEFKCTLTPDSVSRLSAAISCLSKFNETLGLEITSRSLTLISINPLKTTCASISLDASSFFQTYLYFPDPLTTTASDTSTPPFRCQLYNKSLSAVFRGRAGDARDTDSTLARCDLALQASSPDRVDCHLLITLVSRSGVRRIYRLNYDDSDLLRAVVGRAAARNRWAMSAYMLKAFGEYFGPKTELLDFYGESEAEGRVTLTSYTEKVVRGSEVLKQPLQTQIEVDVLDFAEYSVEAGMHVGISVKDFRALVVHAETLKTTVAAEFERPGRPMRLQYGEQGMGCQFVLSTTGQFRGAKSPTPAPSRQSSVVPQRSASVVPQGALPTRPSAAPAERGGSVRGNGTRQPSVMPPPAAKPSQRATSTSGIQPGGLNFASTARSFQAPAKAPSSSVDASSLFVTEDDNEQQWDEVDYAAEEEDQLGWGNTYGDTPLKTLTQVSVARRNSVVKESFQTEQMESLPYDASEVPPTQAIDEMKGLFD